MQNNKWITLADGGSDTWLFVKRGGARQFFFVEVTDMRAATGDDYGDRYVGEVKLVDLDAIGEKEIASAIKCCGGEDWIDDLSSRPGFDRDLAIAECCQSYGCYAPVHSSQSNNRRNEERAARRAAADMIADSDTLADAMDRPVNALGSTASEYMRGDFTSAMQRGCEAGDPGARIMAKMYQIPQETIDDVRPEDWLPYVMGYMAAKQGGARETSADVAPEYHRGFDRGMRVLKGEAPAPGWIKENSNV